MISDFKLSQNQVLTIVILGTVVFFVFILPLIDLKNKQELDKLKEGLTNVNDIPKLDLNRCSKQCCGQSNWPVPHMVKDEEMKNYVGSNFSCNLGSGSGCLCVSKDDVNYLSKRGNNQSCSA